MADQRPPAAAVSERSWTITGASAETRELVREAAAKDGLTIRAWVDKTLNAAAKAALDDKPSSAATGAGARAADDRAVAELSAKMDMVLHRLGADAQEATSSLQAPLAAVYERFLSRTAEVFDELGETSRRLAEAAAEAESEAAQAIAKPSGATAARPQRSSAKPKSKPKPKPKSPPAAATADGKPKPPPRGKPPRKARGKVKKRPGS